MSRVWVIAEACGEARPAHQAAWEAWPHQGGHRPGWGAELGGWTHEQGAAGEPTFTYDEWQCTAALISVLNNRVFLFFVLTFIFFGPKSLRCNQSFDLFSPAPSPSAGPSSLFSSLVLHDVMDRWSFRLSIPKLVSRSRFLLVIFYKIFTWKES